MSFSTLVRRFQFILLICVLGAAPAFGAEYGILAEGLQAMYDEADERPEYYAVRDLGEQVYEELGTRHGELENLRRNTPGFLLENEDGNLIGVTEAEARTLAHGFAADLVAAPNPYALVRGMLSRGMRGNQLEYALGEAVMAGFMRTDEGPEELGGMIENALLDLLHDIDLANRATLDQEITELLAARDRIYDISQRAEQSALVYSPKIPVPDQPEGFMNEPGYWIVQYSGTGWRKGGAGWATEITGYENIIVNVSDEVTEPTLSRWYWTVPVGFDIQVFERQRQEAAEEASREACEDLPPLGPQSPEPDIWSDGPHYEIVEGPIADWGEAQARRGNSRLSNNDPEGSRFWHHDGDHHWDDLDPVCERYGVSLVD